MSYKNAKLPPFMALPWLFVLVLVAYYLGQLVYDSYQIISAPKEVAAPAMPHRDEWGHTIRPTRDNCHTLARWSKKCGDTWIDKDADL